MGSRLTVGQQPLELFILGSNPSSPARYHSIPCFAYMNRMNRSRAPNGARANIKFFYIYVLKSLHKNFIYIGFTEDLRRRLEEHNSGKSKSTKSYLPFELIHYEAYRNTQDAKRREHYLKTNKGRTTLKTMLAELLK